MNKTNTISTEEITPYNFKGARKSAVIDIIGTEGELNQALLSEKTNRLNRKLECIF